MTLFGFARKNQPETGLASVRDSVSELADRVRALERGRKDLELEWENAYDKVHKAVQRLNKARRDLEKAEDRSGQTNGDGGGEGVGTDFRSRILNRRRTHAR